jgi:hypothetical protein
MLPNYLQRSSDDRGYYSKGVGRCQEEFTNFFGRLKQQIKCRKGFSTFSALFFHQNFGENGRNG